MHLRCMILGKTCKASPVAIGATGTTCNKHNMRRLAHFVRRRNKVAYCTRKKVQKIAVRNYV